MSKQRFISQDAFDEVVMENINDLDMEINEAIEDAVQQFEAQNVNLSNIIRNMVQINLSNTDGDGQHPINSALNQLTASLSSEPADIPAMIKSLETIREQCAIDLAHRCLAGKNKGMDSLFNALQVSLNHKSCDGIDASLKALISLLDGQPDIVTRDQMAFFVDLLKGTEGNETKAILTEEQLANVGKVLQTVSIKHEENRQALVALGIIPIAVRRLGWDEATEDINVPGRLIVREMCALMQALTLDDDIRVPFGKAHEHAKAMVTETPSLQVLLRVCRAFKEEEDHEVVSIAFVTLSNLSVRNEFCQTLLDCGGVALILESLSNHVSNQTIVRTSLALLKSLAGNDNVKVEVGRCGGFPIVLEAMQRFVANAPIAQNGCAALAAICLRNPPNGQMAIDAGAAPLLEQILKVNMRNADVVRQVCQAVRNIVSRRQDLRPAFLGECAFEQMFNDVGMNVCPDEAKAALRDLGCNVALRELWTGEKGQIVADGY